MDLNPDRLVEALVKVIQSERLASGLSFEDFAGTTGLHRTTLGLYEKGERRPTVEAAAMIANAIGKPLSSLIRTAEDLVNGSQVSEEFLVRRKVPLEGFRNESKLRAVTGLSTDCIRSAILDCYQTLDTIDAQLAAHGAEPISQLVELANLSSMIGNLLGSGIAEGSNGLYKRNRSHAYPDLIPQNPSLGDLEIKVALEKNKPKGHLPKAGNYLTFRYVLCNDRGCYSKGKEQRGTRVFIWEVKTGTIGEGDFDISNTDGDSGKTAVIKSTVFNAMPLVYFDRDLLPYSRSNERPYPGFN